LSVEPFGSSNLNVEPSTSTAQHQNRSAAPVLDLNHILLFVAVVSPLVVVARTARHGARNRSWLLAAIAVWIVTALAFLIAPNQAGFVGGGAWLILLFLPVIGSRKASELALMERYGAARRMVGVLRWLHPTAEMRGEHAILRAMELARVGNFESASHLLEIVARENTRAGRHAVALRLRVRGDWEGLLAWCRANVPRVGLGDDPSLLLLYFRALGELGLRDELVVQIAGRTQSLLASPVLQSLLASSLLLLFVFCGRSAVVEELLQNHLRGLTSDLKEYWLARSLSAAGDPAGEARLEQLRRTTSDALLRADLSRPAYPESPLHPSSQATALRFERDLLGTRSSLLAPQSLATPAVVTIIALNAAMFVLEIFSGGSQNTVALHRLGALEPSAVFALHQYWRLGAALFLHYGALHLIVNAYALYVLGPSLENSIGSLRFVVCYLVSGIGSSAGVVALWRLGLTQADLLVGASGAVMGIVGTWAGLLLGHRHMPMARRRLLNIAIIVGIQTVFDFSTPQVSMGAHLSGFVTGVLVGLIIAPQSEPA
jgi:rhomboid protease GluP